MNSGVKYIPLYQMISVVCRACHQLAALCSFGKDSKTFCGLCELHNLLRDFASYLGHKVVHDSRFSRWSVRVEVDNLTAT